MNPRSLKFAYNKFLQYYRDLNKVIEPPPEMQKREFGFLLLKGTRMLRHRGFQTIGDLRSSLQNIVPAAVYYSSAYYEKPAAEEMNQKDWVGADLVFDIDADHIPTPCDKVHDSWLCKNCGSVGRGLSPEKCPRCGEARLDTKKWACEVCLESAKKEAIKLLNMLKKDFGFVDNEIKAYFSGNRGYHVHVESGKTRFLDSMARKEIVDYVIGLGLKAELHKLIEDERIIVEPALNTPARTGNVGWTWRICSGIYDFLAETTPAEIKAIGLNKRVVDYLVKNKEALLENMENRGWLVTSGVGLKNWKKIIQWVASRQSAKVDTVVTTDVHRLIRLAGSLHGKTGLMKREAPISGFGEFDPLKEAVAFEEGQVTIEVDEAPEFRIGNAYYGPFQNVSRVELPTAAALFLLCKGAAQVVE